MRTHRELSYRAAGSVAVSIGLVVAALVSAGCEDVEPAALGTGGSNATVTVTVTGAGGQGGPGSGGTGGETTAMGGGGAATTTAGGGMGGTGGVGAGGMETGGGGMGGAGGGMVATVVPDFSLVDLNPNSTTYEQPVSPRDHLGKVSAWYFGHST